MLTAVAYYSTGIPKFNESSQSIPGFITCLRNADPFEARWAIVAKAYSMVRDSVSKECVFASLIAIGISDGQSKVSVAYLPNSSAFPSSQSSSKKTSPASSMVCCDHCAFLVLLRFQALIPSQ